MSVEKKRGCGFRKVGGLYMVGGGIGIPCDRLPFELAVCSCCGQGIKQARGWTWVDVSKLFQGPHRKYQLSHIYPGAVVGSSPCTCMTGMCPLCFYPENMKKAGLLWIGEKFYKTPAQFVKEGIDLGFSRRIKAVPQGFKIGETWVLLAHAKAVIDPTYLKQDTVAPLDKPGIFYAWRPQRLEKLVLESTRGTEEIDALEKRGIIPVFVPDNDKDHQGNVHDDLECEKHKEKSDEDTE